MKEQLNLNNGSNSNEGGGANGDKDNDKANKDNHGTSKKKGHDTQEFDILPVKNKT